MCFRPDLDSPRSGKNLRNVTTPPHTRPPNRGGSFRHDRAGFVFPIFDDPAPLPPPRYSVGSIIPAKQIIADTRKNGGTKRETEDNGQTRPDGT